MFLNQKMYRMSRYFCGFTTSRFTRLTFLTQGLCEGGIRDTFSPWRRPLWGSSVDIPWLCHAGCPQIMMDHDGLCWIMMDHDGS